MELIDIHIPENEGQKRPSQRQNRGKPLTGVNRIGMLVIIAILAASLPFAFSAIQGAGKMPKATKYLALHGYFAMTEKQLITIVKDNNLNVYWLGPEISAKYALDVTNEDRISVRYLPHGLGLKDLKDTYLIVQTYFVKSAYTAILNAGREDNGVSFVNVDGNAVFYDRLAPENVYVGISGQNYEIEIYTKQTDQALAMALTINKLQKIA